MADAKWFVDKFYADRLRIEPRGQQGSSLELTLYSATPLAATTQAALIADIAARMRPALLADAAVQRFLALKKKREQIESDRKTAELSVRKWTAEKELLTCAAYTPDQPEQMRMIEQQLRSHQHTVGGLDGMLGQLEREISKARAEAERVLRRQLDKETAGALHRYQARRDELLRQFCAANADQLDELASVVQSVTQASLGGPSLLMFEFQKLLDTATLPEGASESVAPVPPPAPAEVPPARARLVKDGRGGFMVAPVESTEPPAEPAASVAESEPPEDEPRGKGKRRAVAKAE